MINLDASITSNWGARAYGDDVCSLCDKPECSCALPSKFRCDSCRETEWQGHPIFIFDGEVDFCLGCWLADPVVSDAVHIVEVA